MQSGSSARFYHPETGRFLTEDPIEVAGGMNLYAFALGDPVSRHDPTGSSVDCEWKYGATGNWRVLANGDIDIEIGLVKECKVSLEIPVIVSGGDFYTGAYKGPTTRFAPGELSPLGDFMKEHPHCVQASAGVASELAPTASVLAPLGWGGRYLAVAYLQSRTAAATAPLFSLPWAAGATMESSLATANASAALASMYAAQALHSYFQSATSAEAAASSSARSAGFGSGIPILGAIVAIQEVATECF
jgi:hypothetical protein